MKLIPITEVYKLIWYQRLIQVTFKSLTATCMEGEHARARNVSQTVLDNCKCWGAKIICVHRERHEP